MGGTDGWALAKQTSDNLLAGVARLKEVAGLAREAGRPDLAGTIEGAAARFDGAAGLATDLKTLIEVKERIDLVQRLLRTTAAVAAVDLRDPGAAGAFDAWFAALGETGEAIADAGGMWGEALKPFATFIRLFGETNLFTFVRESYATPHGTRDPNSGNARAWQDAME